MIRTSGLTKHYGRVVAVDGVDLEVQEGDVYGFLGPNGSGKTTTVRMLLGLVLATSGSIELLGRPMPGSAGEVLPSVGALVEGPAAYAGLSGRANLALIDAMGAGGVRSSRAGRIDDALERVGLGGIDRRPVRAYSLGMRQRLGLASALMRAPRLLVLDEPTNGLDPPQIAEMREVLQGYAASGRTVVVSSHLLAEVEQTCTHVVVMHRGSLVAAGSVAEIAGAGGLQLAVDDPVRAAEVLAAAGIASHAVPARRALEDVFLDLVGEESR
jgi:ABC-type multidrug transport system ATPase subunit